MEKNGHEENISSDPSGGAGVKKWIVAPLDVEDVTQFTAFTVKAKTREDAETIASQLAPDSFHVVPATGTHEGPAYSEYACPECGHDRELEEDTWICGHCGHTKKRETDPS